ncbi:DUF742 domain-containing protein [Amycolatopsis pithecellobii]|uniref:DUF742 domain-containing protein n=1 Tax=Amycolatopsis pithecellobii TaxID=664692 RepID=A0A6N7Z7C6_9PSEU|nr:DUF742 domain-containing protein [Amycolatopsis pithecellobii]MTD55786.1 DUF742 domain-containing protein [Amycolatopsis pithecellobii]
MADQEWYDEAAGPLVRPYAITRGRIPTEAAMDVATQVMAIRGRQDPVGLTPEHQAILELCQRPLSVAEVAAYVKVPLAVVRVLCTDLVERGDVIVRSPSQSAKAPDRQLLQAVLHGLNNL